MAEPTLAEKLAELLPCTYHLRDVQCCNPDKHDERCPASHRPAVITAMRELIAPLRDVIRPGLYAPSGMPVCVCRRSGINPPECWYCLTRSALDSMIAAAKEEGT